MVGIERVGEEAGGRLDESQVGVRFPRLAEEGGG